jgi:TonB family protein
LLEFRHYDAEPDLKGRKAYTITVKSLPSRFPNDKEGMVLTPENKKVVFLEEARRASEKIVTDTSRVYPEGEYFFTVVFSIETPIDKKSSLEMEIAPSQKREAGPNAPASAPDTTLEARYPGGSDAWMAFLEKNFKYPLSAYSKNAQGTVVVQFKVEKTGELRDIKVVTDPVPGSGLAEEAIRIFKLSGKWEPAMKNGHAVASYKREPLVFRID